MATIFLVHWNQPEGNEKAERLRASGFEVDFRPVDQSLLRKLRQSPPDAIVIDLTRLPSHGRDVGMGLRSFKATRHVPLVFVDGDAEKVARIRKLLPDAVYTRWGRIAPVLKRAMAKPPVHPVVPKSIMESYAGRSLPQKLGIKSDMTISLVNPPTDFVGKLGVLPERCKIVKGLKGQSDLIIWFVKSEKIYRRDLKTISEHLAEKGGVWVTWPKKSSGVPSDLTQIRVRKIGLASGLVDHKICAVDDVWSALRFVVRKGK